MASYPQADTKESKARFTCPGNLYRVNLEFSTEFLPAMQRKEAFPFPGEDDLVLSILGDDDTHAIVEYSPDSVDSLLILGAA
jgi:hypothetical protein